MKAGHVIALCIICSAAGAQLGGTPVGLGGTTVGLGGTPVGLVNSSSQMATPFKAIEYRNVAQGTNSRITTARADVINNPAAWQQFYSQMAGDPKPGFTPAPILTDFTRYDLLVIHLGVQQTSGHSAYVSMVRNERGSEVFVDVVINQPARNSQLQRMVNSPYVVVYVQKQSVPYTFRSTYSYSTTTYLGGAAQCGCTCGCPTCAGGHGGFGGYGNQRSPGSPFGSEICPPMQRGGRGGD